MEQNLLETGSMLNSQLDTFFQVVECGSFAKAAQRRYCSAVSVMNQINALEDRIGIALLERTTQGVSLTKAGEAFYRDALKIRELARDAMDKAKRIAQENTATIRLGTSFLRPCKPLLDYLEKAGDYWRKDFQMKIVTFNDNQEEFTRLQRNLGKDIDCFISPCDSAHWRDNFNILPLGTCQCRVSMPAKHRLAKMNSLAWRDLYGETLMLVAKGISPVIDRLRQDITNNHPEINIIDSPDYYDMEAFNKCVEGNYIMETPDTWAGLHPSLVTLPVEWGYSQPYGIVYAKNPSSAFANFVNIIKSSC